MIHSKSFHTVAKADSPIYADTHIQKLVWPHAKANGEKLIDKVSELKGKSFKEEGITYRGIGG